MIGCIVRSTDFERVLRLRSRASSAHFALHHLADAPTRGKPVRPATKIHQLSTGCLARSSSAVDDTLPAGLWLGTVVPKRHARRSVTRNLIKRQIRAAMGRHADHLPAGLWVVRLRAAFDRAHFTSAASDELKRASRAELEQVLMAVSQQRAACL